MPVKNIGPGTYTAEVVLPTPGYVAVAGLTADQLDNPVTTLEFTVGTY